MSDNRNDSEMPKIPEGSTNSENSENEPTPSVNDEPVIDPELKEELEENFPEDPFLTEYATQNQDGQQEKVETATDWIGDKDNWKVKSKLSATQIIALSQVRMLPEVYEDELGHMEPMFEKMVENMEQYAVSHQGMAREQHVSVLRSLFGGEGAEDSSARSAILEAFALSESENED